MAEDRFTGSSLEEALRSGKLEESGSLELVGMVKAAEEPGKISFTRTDCDSWVDIPTNLIDSAEQLGQRSCGVHSHPLFRVQLKEPKDPEARVLAALLTSSAETHGRPPPLPVQGFGGLRSWYHGMGLQARASRGWRIPIGPIVIGSEGEDCIYVDDTYDRVFCVFCPTLTSCWNY
jgi:hypothetical protein